MRPGKELYQALLHSRPLPIKPGERWKGPDSVRLGTHQFRDLNLSAVIWHRHGKPLQDLEQTAYQVSDHMDG